MFTVGYGLVSWTSTAKNARESCLTFSLTLFTPFVAEAGRWGERITLQKEKTQSHDLDNLIIPQRTELHSSLLPKPQTINFVLFKQPPHIVRTLIFEHLSANRVKKNRVLKRDHYEIAVYSDRMEMDLGILKWGQKISKQLSHCSWILCFYLSSFGL